MKNIISDILMVAAISLVLGGAFGIWKLYELGITAEALYGIGLALIIAVGTMFGIANDLDNEVGEDEEERL